MNSHHETAYAKARGLGAAGHATGHWRAQRISAIALVPLALWLALALFGGVAADRAALTAWLRQPVNMILMILLLLAAFHHVALGLQVVAEDYIHTRARFAAIALIQLLCVAGAAVGIVATLTMALTG
ncbi:succinate dehydrogenase, hydrophobic membrane anchor protein [uncultured Aliiroseovarius sp.]|uniref:succinate dehydrogenase, hydrophobic membrane anchor protein n=1 Tax=uncultured Aliiroseovarius sp. TaxID=1658783 RepID=UPI0025998A22|nr:succinate dehydrogenase, hydrophobic membrane anchor protein [uncultured Aliiroseovarius sp.]